MTGIPLITKRKPTSQDILTRMHTEILSLLMLVCTSARSLCYMQLCIYIHTHALSLHRRAHLSLHQVCSRTLSVLLFFVPKMIYLGIFCEHIWCFFTAWVYCTSYLTKGGFLFFSTPIHFIFSRPVPFYSRLVTS